MGGNTFKGLSRVKREDLNDLLHLVVDTLKFPGLTLDYLQNSLLGSTGKKETSGDVDLCMNNYLLRFVGEPEYPVFDFKEFRGKLESSLGKQNVVKGSGTQLFTKWGDYQVDFLFGPHDWMKFSHYSPTEEESAYKGLFLVNSFGVLAKMKRDLLCFDLEGKRVAQVNMVFNLEKGLRRSWKMEKKNKWFLKVDDSLYKVSEFDNLKTVDPDEFETKVPFDRFERFFTCNPRDYLDMFFGKDVQFEQVNTFEKVVEFLRGKSVYPEFRQRLLDQHHRHSEMKRTVDYQELERLMA